MLSQRDAGAVPAISTIKLKKLNTTLLLSSDGMAVFWSKELIDELRVMLNEEMDILSRIVKDKQLKGRSKEITVMIWSLCSVGGAMLHLSRFNENFYAECVMLARGFFERLVNVCYILLCSDAEFKSCMDHTIFKQYQVGSDNKKVAKDKEWNILMNLEVKRSNNETLKSDPRWKDAINEFETRTKWQQNFPVPKIEERLGFLIKQETKMSTDRLLFYQFTYYGDASEALHWSLYGSVFHLWDLHRPQNGSVKSEVNKKFSFLIVQTIQLFHQLIVLLKEKNGFKESLYNESLELSNKAMSLFEQWMKE